MSYPPNKLNPATDAEAAAVPEAAYTVPGQFDEPALTKKGSNGSIKSSPFPKLTQAHIWNSKLRIVRFLLILFSVIGIVAVTIFMYQLRSWVWRYSMHLAAFVITLLVSLILAFIPVQPHSPPSKGRFTTGMILDAIVFLGLAIMTGIQTSVYADFIFYDFCGLHILVYNYPVYFNCIALATTVFSCEYSTFFKNSSNFLSVPDWFVVDYRHCLGLKGSGSRLLEEFSELKCVCT